MGRPPPARLVSDELLAVCERAAQAAGAVLRAKYAGRDGLETSTKTTATDPVSEADLLAERAIRDLLARERPDDAILGEEGGDIAGTTGLRWVVDPLDGTVNFLFGLPQFSVSVAVQDADGTTLAGAIYDPLHEQCFTAIRDGDARLGTTPLRASQKSDLSQALIATGFSYDARVRARQAEVLAQLLPRARDIRRFGSAALDLAWTAAGRYDAYYERAVKLWDVAAGLLICDRAGLAIRDMPATSDLPAGVLVAPPGLIDELAAIVSEA